jgi:cytoplasmic iron level regulating protein YaaA (DUF328/UPF0246 family)
MKTVVLIACASKKLTHRAKAADLYQSDLFRKSLAYARKVGTSVFILSAKHGLIRPEDAIDPYDVTLKTMSSAEVKAWSDRVFRQLANATDVRNDHFIFLAGERYRRDLVPQLSFVEVPLEGLRIGEQLSFLSKRLA